MHANLHSAWVQNKKIDKQGDTMANYKIISNAFNDYVLGMKYKQIAFKYGVKLNTVKSWVHRYEWARKRREVATNAPCSLDISQVNIKKIFLNLDLELDIDFKNNEVRNIKVINKNEV